MPTYFRFHVPQSLWQVGMPCMVRDMRIAGNGHDGWKQVSAMHLAAIMTDQADDWCFTQDVPPA